jgi:phosphatidylserine/phosphatidylglycerophosphate/cardiolipin synthase-like enzyme
MKTQTKEKIYIAIILLLIAISAQSYYTYQYQPAHQIQVYYNQDHPLNDEIISLIRDADKFIYFGIYTFSRQDIKDALLAAKYRGLKVVGIADKNQYQSLDLQKKIIDELRRAEIPVYEQDHSAIMHLKVLVTEKAYASGSYNWTASGTNLNDEVLEIGRDENIRRQYQNIMEEIFERYGDGD